MKTAFLMAASVWTTACAAQENMQFVSDYQEARKISRETGKPIFVQFRCEA